MAIEEAARRARYAFLREVALSVGARRIAVAHNADDQAETVLMHWLRGSGLAGLRGMLPCTPLQEYRLFEGEAGQGLAAEGGQPAGLSTESDNLLHSRLELIRPLLEVTRDEIDAYCDFHGLTPRYDLSNLDTTIFRNWLRHEMIPLLAQHNPKVRETIRRSARVISDEYALLRALLDATWPQVVVEEPAGDASQGESRGQRGRIVFDLAEWRALPTALQRSTLREAIHRLRRSLRNINYIHVENALVVARDGSTGDQATLPQGLMLTLSYNDFAVADEGVPEPLPEWPFLTPEVAPVPVKVPGFTRLPGSEWVLEARIQSQSDLPEGWEENQDPWCAYLDAESLSGSIALRLRLAGDRFQPLGMGGHTVKLADFYTNQKVPRVARDRLPLLADKEKILWVCGWRSDERCRVSGRIEQVLVLRFVRPG
jgi:tRNA(Ile)-lysidine synthase